MTTAFSIIDWIFFVLLGFSVLYLFVFAVASLFARNPRIPVSSFRRKIAVFIPAYKEDWVITDSVEASLAQDYPADCYEVTVISDRMAPDTVAALKQMPVRVLEIPPGENTKAKALNFAFARSGGPYDIAVVLDADNVCGPRFLSRINDAFGAGYRAVQAHRCAKNLDTPMAVLDAVSEEINNSIFRKGHQALGFSSALIGSGMAFDYKWFGDALKQVHTAGEDKEIENLLLNARIPILYLEQERVLDEKTGNAANFSRQRRRWLAAQFYHLKEMLPGLGAAVRSGNGDMVNKIFQMFVLPRVIVLGLVTIWTLSLTLSGSTAAVKWWILSAILVVALAVAVPRRLVGIRLVKAVFHIPVAFGLMFLNFFRMKGAGKRFIHTRHGAGQ